MQRWNHHWSLIDQGIYKDFQRSRFIFREKSLYQNVFKISTEASTMVKKDIVFYTASNLSSLSIFDWSNQITVQQWILTSLLFTVLSSFVSVILRTEIFELINKVLSCSIFGRMLLMLRYPQWRPLFLNNFNAGSFSGNVCWRFWYKVLLYDLSLYS